MSLSKLTDEVTNSLQSLGIIKPDPSTVASTESTTTDTTTASSSFGNIGHALLNVPFPEMLNNLATSIATSQFELDLVGARMAQIMAGAPVEDTEQAITVDFAGEPGLTLFELGFSPTFYQFTETEIEIKMTMSYSSEYSSTSESSQTNIHADAALPLGLMGLKGPGGALGAFAGWKNVLTGTPPLRANLNISTMSTEIMSKYSIKAEGTSTLRTKIVPIPTPAVLTERIRDTVEKRNKLKKLVQSLDDNSEKYLDNYSRLQQTSKENLKSN